MIYYIIDSELYKPIIYYQFYNYFTYHQTQKYYWCIPLYHRIEIQYEKPKKYNILFGIGLYKTYMQFTIKSFNFRR
jgi:hypothetical protein